MRARSALGTWVWWTLFLMAGDADSVAERRYRLGARFRMLVSEFKVNRVVKQ